MRLIHHHRITAPTPRESGTHERTYRTLRRSAIRPARAKRAAHRRAFNVFRAECNDERPHETFGMETAAAQSARTPRRYPATLPVPEYLGLYTVKTITTGDTLGFGNRVLDLANALTGTRVERYDAHDGVRHICFNTVLIATLDERDYMIKE